MGKKKGRNGAGWTNRDLDPFETHSPDRKFDCWTSELREVEEMLVRAQSDPSILQSEHDAQKYGGRLVDLRNRIVHVKKMLATPAMRLIARQLAVQRKS